MAKLTVRDLQESKGKKKFTQICVSDQYAARACALAGIDMLACSATTLKQVRVAAPDCFITSATPNPPHGNMESDATAIQACCAVMGDGADAVYLYPQLDRIRAVAKMGVPVFSHVGYVPWHKSWIGGTRAVGKTAEEALRVYRDTLALQDAGAIGVEMELVPDRVAAEITRRVNICVVSMGSGPNCDAEYLFACDILGMHDGHYPRHAKIYRNHLEDSVAAFREFRRDVDAGTFPAKGNMVGIQDQEFENFMSELD